MNEARQLPRLTDPEFEIMTIVWDEREVAVNRVWEMINRKRTIPVARTTILVQMNRLEEKRWLRHRAQGRTFLYSPTREKGETLEALVEDLHSRFFNGSCTDLVRCLLKTVKVSREEIAELRGIIDRRKGDPE